MLLLHLCCDESNFKLSFALRRIEEDNIIDDTVRDRIIYLLIVTVKASDASKIDIQHSSEKMTVLILNLVVISNSFPLAFDLWSLANYYR